VGWKARRAPGPATATSLMCVTSAADGEDETRDHDLPPGNSQRWLGIDRYPVSGKGTGEMQAEDKTSRSAPATRSHGCRQSTEALIFRCLPGTHGSLTRKNTSAPGGLPEGRGKRNAAGGTGSDLADSAH